MSSFYLSKATLGRLPLYLKYLLGIIDETEMISATKIANDLGLGEVLVRKDLASVISSGRPKVGHNVKNLVKKIQECLCYYSKCNAVIIGAGNLGRALLDYPNFSDYGVEIIAAFDKNMINESMFSTSKVIKSIDDLSDFCKNNEVKIGIITVPNDAAQDVCNQLVANGIKAIWSFAQTKLVVPTDVIVQYEDLALSLAHLYNIFRQTFNKKT